MAVWIYHIRFSFFKKIYKSSSVLSVPDLTNVIPSLYNQLKVQLGSSPEDEKPPVVYGLGSVYCASLVAFVSLVSVVLALLLGDGIAPSLTLATLSLYLCLEMYSAVVAISNCSDEESFYGEDKKKGVHLATLSATLI